MPEREAAVNSHGRGSGTAAPIANWGVGHGDPPTVTAHPNRGNVRAVQRRLQTFMMRLRRQDSAGPAGETLSAGRRCQPKPGLRRGTNAVIGALKRTQSLPNPRQALPSQVTSYISETFAILPAAGFARVT